MEALATTALVVALIAAAGIFLVRWQVICQQKAHAARTRLILSGKTSNVSRVSVTRHARWLMIGLNPSTLYQ